MSVLIKDAHFLASATSVEGLPPPTVAEITFAGRSNVGKSSLINRLLERRKLVRTSSTPGCTRALNLFRIEFDVGTLDFVDLPGYGYAKRSKLERAAWGPMIEGFLAGRPGLRACVVIVDVRRGVQPEEAQLLEFLEHVAVRPVLVATKLDKLPRNQRKPALAKLKQTHNQRFFGFSATSGEGRDALLSYLLKAADLSGPEPAQR